MKLDHGHPSHRARGWLSFVTALGGLFLVSGCQSATGSGSTGVATLTGDFPLLPRVSLLRDESGSMTLADAAAVLESAALEPASVPNFGYISDAVWLRFTLRNPTSAAAYVLIEVDSPHLDDVTLYRGVDPASARDGGRRDGYHARPYPHPSVVFHTALQANRTETFHLRVSSEDTVAIPIRVWSPASFARHREQWSWKIGLYFGLVLALACYNFFLFVSVRDRQYLLYSLTMITAHGLFSLVEHGLAYQYLWPDWPELNRRALPAVANLGMMTSALVRAGVS